MMNRISVEPDSIDKWLELATMGLVRAAQEEVAREYRAHYEEALREKGREGFHGFGAELEALRELGDALALRRKLSDAHFTDGDVFQLRWMGALPWDDTRFPRLKLLSNLCVFGFGLAAMVLALGVWSDSLVGSGQHIFCLYIFSDTLPNGVAALFRIRGNIPFTRQTVRQIAMAQTTLAMAGLGLFATLLWWSRDPNFQSVIYSNPLEMCLDLAFAVLMCLGAWRMWRIASKLPASRKAAKT